MYLIDTNIFLSVLLGQEKSERCRRFLSDNRGSLHISDFSLHSIGVILFRSDRPGLFQKFVEDALPLLSVQTLPLHLYKDIPDVRNRLGLDFDDAYQYLLARYNRSGIVTMDADFQKTKDIKVISI